MSTTTVIDPHLIEEGWKVLVEQLGIQNSKGTRD
jgi:hypothetical protein